jgi:hypothetical protein
LIISPPRFVIPSATLLKRFGIASAFAFIEVTDVS